MPEYWLEGICFVFHTFSLNCHELRQNTFILFSSPDDTCMFLIPL